MNERTNKVLTLCANIGIVLSTIMVGFLLIQWYRFDRSLATRNNSILAANNQNNSTPKEQGQMHGMKLSVSGVDWEKNGSTLLFVLSKSCHFCRDSSPFYRKAIKEKQTANIRFVALFPQDRSEGAQYLKDMGIAIQDVAQVIPNSIGVNGFPTLILVDNIGTVKKAWVGQLTLEQEADVIKRIKCPTCS